MESALDSMTIHNQISMDTECQFKHSPLLDPARQIRLVKLQTSISAEPTGSDLIILTTDVYDLNKSPLYVGISYTWGPVAPTRQIMLNGKTLEIRENLWQFLSACRRALRRSPVVDDGDIRRCFEKKYVWDDQRCIWEYQRRGGLANLASQYLWIDQLCINQLDIREKSHQVQLMGDIFSSARFVVGWLGIEGVDSEHAKLYIEQLGRGPLSFMAIASASTTTRRLAVGILQRPYWSRLWIMQELALAREVVFVCGDWVCPWDELTNLSGLDGAGEWVTSCYGALTVAQSPRPLHEVILNFHGLEESKSGGFLLCEKRIDKIYGLMGMVVYPQRLVVDYEKTYSEVLLDVVRITVDTLAKRVSVEDWDNGNGQESFDVSEDVVKVSCIALGIGLPTGLCLRKEWEDRIQHKRTIGNKTWRWLKGMYVSTT